MQPYTKDFYEVQQHRSLRAAKEVVPVALELIQPKQVIDVGCGVGTWLSVFKECGVDDIWGLDGDWVDRKMLHIPEERFLSIDLTKSFQMERQFDLVVSLEVAEHLPSEYAETFVDSLTRLGPVVLFSAAIPFQGGKHHVNEQWPDYWLKYFQDRGYVVIDCIRNTIWQNDNVPWTYAQNILMFVSRDYLESHPLLKRELENTSTSQLCIVHPNNYLRVWELVERARHSPDPRDIPLRKILSALPIVMAKELKRIIKCLIFKK